MAAYDAYHVPNTLVTVACDDIGKEMLRQFGLVRISLSPYAEHPAKRTHRPAFRGLSKGLSPVQAPLCLPFCGDATGVGGVRTNM